ncbi:hypothetical protein SISSUDRAFT_1129684 [Sistotremastrum suecicum HHB10207 ss-3]|uniref:F-box domain-containing protein n=1 Tax=Sistotremastrum suecicum HHB10207 ss-3 TaxID=1314776 RepID=A0A166CEE5_9AGAM|nr:hypothetical protein SISSUDRAFT_1129684 [Sistotremastrum suecicum HHB10207 ss-3]
MHRFWNIQELVEGTFEHLTPRELSRCARTSKHISNYALNRLYRHVNRLTDILKILGRLTVTMEDHGLCKKFENELEQKDWDRVLKYSSRTHTLFCGWGGRHCDYVADETFEILAGSASHGPLFPNLLKITWIDTEQHMIVNVASFATPFLTSLTIDVPVARDFSIPLLELAKKAPNLEDLDLDFKWPRLSDNLPEKLQGFDEVLIRLHNLKTLRLPHSWVQFVSIHGTLSKLLQLRVLDMSSRPVAPTYRFPDPSIGTHALSLGPFPKLQEFRFTTSAEASFRTSCFPANVVSLFLDILGAPWSGVRPWMTTFQISCPHLQYLVIASSVPLQSDEEGTDLPLRIMKYALPLRQLKLFELHLEYPLGASDDELRQAALSWPNIEVLRLCPRATDANYHPIPTLGCLEHFARHCPSLTHLGLALNVTGSIDELPDSTYSFSESFKELVLSRSRIAKPIEVGAYLAEHLAPTTVLSFQTGPYACRLHQSFARPSHFAEPDAPALHRQWQIVAEVLSGLRRLRKKMWMQHITRTD